VGRVIDLASRRRLPVDAPEIGRLPLVVRQDREAVALILPGFEWWLTPEQADELAADLRRGAGEARAQRGKGPRPRGA
jgi:hypothetical protein